MMKDKIIALTVGHTPRNDIVPELDTISEGRYDFVEIGGLDGFEEEEILKMQEEIDGEYLVTRIKTGRMVRVEKEFIIQRMDKLLEKTFNAGAKAGVVLCTFDDFDDIYGKEKMVMPKELMLERVKSLATGKKVGIVFPSDALIDVAVKHWSQVSSDVVVKAVLHGAPASRFEEVIEEFKEMKVDIIVLDCIGYTSEMKNKAEGKCQVPVILPRTLIIEALDEMQ